MNTAYLQIIAEDYNEFLARSRRGLLFMIGGGIVLGFLLYSLIKWTIWTATDIYPILKDCVDTVYPTLIEYVDIVYISIKDAYLVFIEEVIPYASGVPSKTEAVEQLMKAMDDEILEVLQEYENKKTLESHYCQDEEDSHEEGLLSLPCKVTGSSTLSPYILGEDL